MASIEVNGRIFDEYVSAHEIAECVKKVAERINKDYAEKEPLFVCILNGAFMFVTDLMRALNGAYELTFARYSSYAGTSSTGVLQEVMPISVDVKGRTIILLEDIIDTGFTMSQVMAKLREQGAEEVRLATMLFKPESLKVDLKPDYVGLQIPPAFIVGHGLDYDEMGRAYRDIYQVVE